MKIIVAGFDGYGRSVIASILEQDKKYEMIILDDKNVGEAYEGIEVVGALEDMQSFFDKGFHGIYIANENSLEWRKKVAIKARDIGFEFVTVIDKSALVSTDAKIGAGTYIAKGVVVDPATIIGDNVIINVGATIQSESTVGDYSRISTAAIISHGVNVGAMCHVGAKSVVTDNTEVPDNTVIDDVSVFGKQFFEEEK